jgi:cytochrome c peroxidase
VTFYATRDTDPGRWYPKRPDGSVAIYDDLPARYRANINMDPPFGGKPGEAPRLTEQEIDAIVAFLNTLTDGWTAVK